MAGEKTVETTGLLGWLDRRFPVTSTWKAHLSEYYAPKNFNFWYFFGSLALLVLVLQIVTGIFLVMHYKPDAERAFQSVEYIMREVPWGWLVRYMHSTGASMFFVVVYLHMLRGLLYGSYRKPRELVWIFGVAIFLCLMAEAFFGYLLPWGQMSWGAQVIVNLFAAIPFIGPELSIWIRGDYVVSDATLNRFFAFHVIAIPLVLVGLVAAHLVALHEVGSNNPDGVEIKQGPKDKYGRPKDGIPFHPFYTVHDLVGVAGFLLVFAAIVFFAPEMGGYFLEFNNFIPADSLKTPPHIAPVWYFTPFYLHAARHHRRVHLGAGGRVRAGRHRAAGQEQPEGHPARRRPRHPDRRGRAAARDRRQVLGRGRHGRHRGHSVLPPVAGPFAGQVDPLPPDLAQVDLRHLHGQLPRPGLHRHAAAQPAAEPDVADRHAAVPGILLPDAGLEPLGTFARARARHVPAPLSPRDNGPTMIKKLIGAVALMMLTCTATFAAEGGFP